MTFSRGRPPRARWVCPPWARPGAAHAAGVPAYDPAARFDLVVSEVELRRNTAGRMLMARIYQPKGPGPFPTVLDLHGGAWNRKDRFAEEPMDRALAASGLLVVAVDMTVAPEAPYPACVQDANWSVRWLKANAANGTVTARRSASTHRPAAATSRSCWRCVRAIRATRDSARRRAATSTPPSPGWRCARPSATPLRATRTPSGAATRA